MCRESNIPDSRPYEVHGLTGDTCGLACIESVCIDNNLNVTQNDMINKYGQHFWHWYSNPATGWVGRPGVLNETEAIHLAELVGIASVKKSQINSNPNENYVRKMIVEKDTVGILIGVHSFFDAQKNLINTDHWLRLGIINNNIVLMDPSTYSKQTDTYTWQEIMSFRPTVVVLKR